MCDFKTIQEAIASSPDLGGGSLRRTISHDSIHNELSSPFLSISVPLVKFNSFESQCKSSSKPNKNAESPYELISSNFEELTQAGALPSQLINSSERFVQGIITSLESSNASSKKIASETIECRAASRPLSDRKHALSPSIPLSMMQSSYSLTLNAVSLPGPSNKIYKKGISSLNKEINITSSSPFSPTLGDLQRIAYSSTDKFPFEVFIQSSKEGEDSSPCIH